MQALAGQILFLRPVPCFISIKDEPNHGGVVCRQQALLVFVVGEGLVTSSHLAGVVISEEALYASPVGLLVLFDVRPLVAL